MTCPKCKSRHEMASLSVVSAGTKLNSSDTSAHFKPRALCGLLFSRCFLEDPMIIAILLLGLWLILVEPVILERGSSLEAGAPRCSKCPGSPCSLAAASTPPPPPTPGCFLPLSVPVCLFLPCAALKLPAPKANL